MATKAEAQKLLERVDGGRVLLSSNGSVKIELAELADIEGERTVEGRALSTPAGCGVVPAGFSFAGPLFRALARSDAPSRPGPLWGTANICLWPVIPVDPPPRIGPRQSALRPTGRG